jgi:hypothetical protein
MSTVTLYSRGPMGFPFVSRLASCRSTATPISCHSPLSAGCSLRFGSCFSGRLLWLRCAQGADDVANELLQSVFLESFRHPSTFFRNETCVRAALYNRIRTAATRYFSPAGRRVAPPVVPRPIRPLPYHTP